MLQATISVAIGGALGSSARFVLGVYVIRLVGQGFPVAILICNVLGSVLMGIAAVYCGRVMPSAAPFLMTGILGGFTTFSAFSLEAVTLIERGQIGQAAAYIGLSVGLSILGLMVGLYMARTIL
ncbi:MAG: fluoride efflux transporter CrcB [Planktomarina sp.]